jgi:hypothetical protein
MKYLKKYKLFEKSESDLDKYLSKMNSSLEDIEDIFIDFIDQNDFKKEIKFQYVDSDYNISKKTDRFKTPRIIIKLTPNSSNSDHLSLSSGYFKDTKYLSNLYYSLDRFYKIYSEFCEEIEWSFSKYEGVYIYCYFKTEENKDIPNISLEEIEELFIEFLKNSELPDYYIYQGYSNGFGIELSNDGHKETMNKIKTDKNYLKKFDDKNEFVNNRDEIRELVDILLLRGGHYANRGLAFDKFLNKKDLGIYFDTKQKSQQTYIISALKSSSDPREKAIDLFKIKVDYSYNEYKFYTKKFLKTKEDRYIIELPRFEIEKI